MDQSAFYGIMSGIKLHAARSVVNAIKGRDGLGGPDSASGRMAYLVSLHFVIPCYALALVVALKPSLVGSAGLALSPLEVEALLLSILVFLGVQEAWVVAMTPRQVKKSAPGPLTAAA